MRPQLTVDLDCATGPVFHGATGALYGLSDDGVPGADLLAPLRLRTISQKPPGGRQHPNGDADQVAPGFFAAGGELIFVLMQDALPDWPYRECDGGEYLALVKSMAASADRSLAFIPFNEPDWIWYDLKTGDNEQYLVNRDRFLADWTAACRAIRSAGALVAGPNEAYYDARFLPDFLAYAQANDVLPDIVTWHELSPDSLRTYRSSHASFRALERRLGLEPRPIAINEYGNRRDLSCPGQLVQWIAMFEETKVHANLAFWDIAGNYGDNAAGQASPTGSWWLLRWYGALTGHTVAVTRPEGDAIDGLSGLAAVDPGKRQARVIVAHPAGGAARVTLAGIDPGVFGERVRVLVQAAPWTGYDGAALTPLDLAATEYPVIDGQIDVDLEAMDPMAAYQLIVSPATGAPTAVVTPPRITRYLAAEARLTGCAVNQQGSAANPQGYAAYGGTDVGPFGRPGSEVEFQVTAEQDGRHQLRVHYGNDTEDIARLGLRIDDQPWSLVSFPPTLNAGFRSHRDVYAQLDAGAHVIAVGAPDSGPGGEPGHGQISLNALALTRVPTSVAGVTHPATHYPAAYADLSGGAVIGYSPGSGPAGTVRAPGWSRIGFVVLADHDGYHRVSAAGSGGNFLLLVGGTDLRTGTKRAFEKNILIYLHAGINRIDCLPDGQTALIDSLDVIPDAAADAEWALTYPAPTDGRLTFTGITAPWSGAYRVIVSYAGNERAGSDNYNVNLVNPAFTVSTSAGTRLTAHARNTYSWNRFVAMEVTVRLAAGENTITIGALSGRAPIIDKIIVAPAVLP